MDNHTIAERLREYANYLESQEMNVYRVRAYRKAAETVLSLDRPLSEIVAQEGRAGLEALPGIGPHLSFTLEGLVRDGEFRTLGPYGGHIDPERLLLSLPGVGVEGAELPIAHQPFQGERQVRPDARQRFQPGSGFLGDDFRQGTIQALDHLRRPAIGAHPVDVQFLRFEVVGVVAQPLCDGVIVHDGTPQSESTLTP